MQYNDFVDYVKNNIKGYLSESYTDAKVTVNDVIKNNDMHLDGLTIIKPNQNVAPTIYLNGIYDEMVLKEKDLDSVMLDIAEIRERHDNSLNFNTDEITNFNSVKDSIVFNVVNYENNKELLTTMPHRQLNDLAVIYKVDLGWDQDEQAVASYKITNQVLERFGVSEQKLYDLALKNTPQRYPVSFRSMKDTISSMFGQEETQDVESDLKQGDVYVLTNSKKIQGAAVMLYPGVMEKLSKEADGNLYILPSSVHEVLVLKNNDPEGAHELSQMVNEVNPDLNQEDVLSNQAYEYDANEKALYTAEDHKLVYKSAAVTAGSCLSKMMDNQYKQNAALEIESPEIEM